MQKHGICRHTETRPSSRSSLARLSPCLVKREAAEGGFVFCCLVQPQTDAATPHAPAAVDLAGLC